MEFSNYQTAIFDFVENGQGGGFVSAVAGSGKTFSLVECAKRLPEHVRQKSVFLAFNKHIATELEHKLPIGMQAKTLNAMGFRVLRDHLKAGRDWRLEQNKYRTLTQIYCERTNLFDAVTDVWRADNENRRLEPAAECEEVTALCQVIEKSITALVDKCMYTLTNPRVRDDVARLVNHFDIDVSDEYLPILMTAIEAILKWGWEGLPTPDADGKTYSIRECFSFSDQVYRPVTEPGMAFPHFDFIFIDEAQDLNECQFQFTLKLRSRNGRMIFVGDPQQAIYGFAGADVESVNKIIRQTEATVLPLSVCYRCPTTHVDLARSIVPHIEAAPNAKPGILQEIKYDDIFKDARKGDYIICRCNAPLISTAFNLIGQGISAKVLGREIGQGLIKIIDKVGKARGFKMADFPDHLAEYVKKQEEILGRKKGNEERIEGMRDRALCVKLIYENAAAERHLHSVGDLRSAVDAIFTDGNATVTLSTVHKAKGLEADRIILLYPELFYSERANAWELKQLSNLEYVAYTRSRDTLLIVPRDKRT